MKHKIFNNLFVLELANNHWGDIARGLKIIQDFAKVMHKNDVYVAMKLQIRDVDEFVHGGFIPSNSVGKGSEELAAAPGQSSRYIQKTLATKLSKEDFIRMVEEIKNQGFISMATPFDEKSVDLCVELGIEVLKIASQDTKSWTLIEKIASAGLPTAVSNGGTDIDDLDRIVTLFEQKNIPLAINHCVSLYPSEDSDLQLNKIDFLKKRYPNNVIGLSTHEYNDWITSVVIGHAKGARTFERHVDIDDGETPVSKYCSLPNQVDEWFKSFKKTIEMSGEEREGPRPISGKEREYVKSVSRGIYALRDLPAEHVISKDGIDKDFYLAIPLQSGQLSSRDLGPDSEYKVKKSVLKDGPIML